MQDRRAVAACRTSMMHVSLVMPATDPELSEFLSVCVSAALYAKFLVCLCFEMHDTFRQKTRMRCCIAGVFERHLCTSPRPTDTDAALFQLVNSRLMVNLKSCCGRYTSLQRTLVQGLGITLFASRHRKQTHDPLSGTASPTRKKSMHRMESNKQLDCSSIYISNLFGIIVLNPSRVTL